MSFQKRLLSDEFVILAEMDTPKGVDISELITNARKVKGRVDAVVKNRGQLIRTACRRAGAAGLL